MYATAINLQFARFADESGLMALTSAGESYLHRVFKQRLKVSTHMAATAISLL